MDSQKGTESARKANAITTASAFQARKFLRFLGWRLACLLVLIGAFILFGQFGFMLCNDGKRVFAVITLAWLGALLFADHEEGKARRAAFLGLYALCLMVAAIVATTFRLWPAWDVLAWGVGLATLAGLCGALGLK